MSTRLALWGRARRWRGALAVSVGLALLAWLAGAVGPWPGDEEAPAEPPAPALHDPALVRRGEALARAGNCMACHAAPDGTPFAGGRGVQTPFGVVYASNLTPDPATGLGAWSANDFWRALHQGRSRDGRRLSPAFPYPNYTRLTREDADALYAFLRTVPPAVRPQPAHAMRFPYGSQAALAVWQALFFRPGAPPDTPGQGVQGGQDLQWQRGRYLVEGLGHCTACHSSRHALGGPAWGGAYAGSLMPDGRWYAPSLADPAEAGVQDWPRDEVVRLLKTGVSARATVSGPMAEVVHASTQYLSDPDLQAMAHFLATIPRSAAGARPQAAAPAPGGVLARGGRLYDSHCASCHGAQGQGVPGRYPALAGNRAVALALPTNLVQVVREGGFLPGTAGNPQPFGMPPFAHLLGEEDIAAVLTFVRQSWGHQAGPVTPLQVHQQP